MFRLDGRVALVTGSSRGLGWAMAQALSAAGATVVLHGRDTEALRARRQELSANGATTDVVPFDVTDSEAGARRSARSRSGTAGSTCSSTTPA